MMSIMIIQTKDFPIKKVKKMFLSSETSKKKASLKLID